MKYIKLLILSLMITLPFVSNAQVGLRANYNRASYDSWLGAATRLIEISNENFLTPQYEVGVDYWFRLKKRRIEFMPELSYTLARSKDPLQNYKSNILSFNFNTHIYVLDMGEDCDCPTFSKSSPVLQKGFFLHLAPGVKYYNLDNGTTKSSTVAPNLRLGIGFDIGLSEFLTISPLLSYNLGISEIEWQEFYTDEDITTTANVLQLGVRMGFRFVPTKSWKRR